MSSTLGRYRILTKLAEGGMGKVYLAALGGPGECPKLSVLKTLKGSLAADRRLRQAFIEEGRLSVRLQHPNIVAAYEVFEEGAVPIMALEYLDGQPLDRIRRDHARSLPLGLHLRILTEALRGLEYFHGLEDIDATPLHPVHRDVSPQNIFVTYTGEVKVLDFGIAKAAHVAGTDETEVGIFKGKLRYIAPEQMRVDLGSAASAADRRSDLYALGVLLWEAIAGRGRWDGVSEGDIFLELLTGSSPCLTPELPGATPAVRALLAKATARAPHARFATASEMREATLAVVDAEMVEAGSDALSRWLTSRYADAKAKRKRLIAERLMELDAGDKGSHLSSWPVEASAPTVSATKMGRRVGRTPDRHLPAVVTGIVGRAAEIASVTTLLERSRLVTLTGPGGIGKTRLAVEVARLGSANFADGVRFVRSARRSTRPSSRRPLRRLSGSPKTHAAPFVTACSRHSRTRSCCSCWTTSSTCSRRRHSCLPCLRQRPACGFLYRAASRSGFPASTFSLYRRFPCPTGPPSSTRCATRPSSFS